MEQRKWKRQGIALDVELKLWHPDGEEIIKCKTMDIGLGGAMLLTGERDLPKFRLLEIHFSDYYSKKKSKQPILAHAVRKVGDKIAIQFRRAKNDTIKQLHEAINVKKVRINPILEYNLPCSTYFRSYSLK